MDGSNQTCFASGCASAGLRSRFGSGGPLGVVAVDPQTELALDPLGGVAADPQTGSALASSSSGVPGTGYWSCQGLYVRDCRTRLPHDTQ